MVDYGSFHRPFGSTQLRQLENSTASTKYVTGTPERCEDEDRYLKAPRAEAMLFHGHIVASSRSGHTRRGHGRQKRLGACDDVAVT